MNFIRLAYETRSFITFLNFLIFKSPIKRVWAWILGYRFHKSTLIWFISGNGIRTRLTLMLPRLCNDLPDLKKVDLAFKIFNEQGRLVKAWGHKDVLVDCPYVIDSKNFEPTFQTPKNYHLPVPFEGSILVTQTLHYPDKKRLYEKNGGLFASAGTYIDYFKAGSFITTLHDYCAYLPDQGLHFKHIGMIPAYENEKEETFLIFHAAGAGIKKRDLTVEVVNAAGEKKQTRLQSMKPFSLRKIFISELFPDISTFLGGRLGQVRVRGNFRCMIGRIAYGIYQKKTKTFSLDHCYYAQIEKKTYLSTDQQKKIKKGFFNPFIVLDNDQTNMSIILFHNEQDQPHDLDILLYDERGKCILKKERFIHVEKNNVKVIRLRELLQEAKISGAFMGHGEILYSSHQHKMRTDLDLYLEIRKGETVANVIFGAKAWNPPRAVVKPEHGADFGCRMVCDDTHTTYFGISNCSHDYHYNVEVHFDLHLIAGGRIIETLPMTIGPEATLYQSIEVFFPHVKEQLKPFEGVGLLSYHLKNANYLVTVFLTEDRKTQALSLEHTLAMPNFFRAKETASIGSPTILVADPTIEATN